MNAAPRLSPGDALRQVRAWGWPFAAGSAGLLLAAGVSLVVVPRIERETRDLAADADRAARHARHAASAASEAGSREPAPARFLAAFPPADARQARVASLLKLAVRHSMAIRHGEFQLAADNASGLQRYSVTLPLTGTYAQLRGFIEDALTSDAALSLDKLRLRRHALDAAAVEADLTWSFYMQPGHAAPPGAGR